MSKKMANSTTDVVIVGSGISGLVLSKLLKEQQIDHVVLQRVEQRKALELPETLPPSTLVLLESLNLLELFSKSSSKTFGYHSLWKSEVLQTDTFFNHNPYKYGLKLNKTQLLQDLQSIVSDHMVSFHNLTELERTNKSVTITVETESEEHTIHGKILVDATGRNRAMVKQLGILSESFDDQIALSCHLPYFKHPKLVHPIFVESFEHGWGIVSPLNNATNAMTLYTQKGSPLLPDLKAYSNWENLLANTKILKDFLSDNPDQKVFGGNANSSRAAQITGPNWLAIGDAAIAFDPLSSHGVSNAIYCASAAAKAIDSEDRLGGIVSYGDTLSQVFEMYLKQREVKYEGVNS
ncbi:MAG: NAD(P)/FAD-dependent oxidoreductase [Crocinitomicaceae bacterium]